MAKALSAISPASIAVISRVPGRRTPSLDMESNMGGRLLAKARRDMQGAGEAWRRFGRARRLTFGAPPAHARPLVTKGTDMVDQAKKRGLELQWQMLIGFLVGLVAGLIVYSTQADARWVEILTTYVTQPIGQIFLRLLFMLVIPLLFSALVVGISEMGEIRSLKRVGLRTLGLHRRRLVDRRRHQPGGGQSVQARRRGRSGRRRGDACRAGRPRRRDRPDQPRAAAAASTRSSTSSPTISSR